MPFGFDEIFSQFIVPLLTQLAGGAIQNAMSPGGNPQPQPQAMQAPQPAGAVGAGTVSRPTNLNFTGGFTGQPPGGSIPSGPVTPPEQGGFSTISPQRKPPVGFGI